MLGDAQTDDTVSLLKFKFQYNKYLNWYGISGETYFYSVGEIFYLLSIWSENYILFLNVGAHEYISPLMFHHQNWSHV